MHEKDIKEGWLVPGGPDGGEIGGSGGDGAS